MKSKWQYLATALILAAFAWFQVSGREKVETWIQLPVEMANQPQDLVVMEGLVNRIDVRVRGPRNIIRSVSPNDTAYFLDLSNLKLGRNLVVFDPRNIKLPGPIEVMEISPVRVELLVDRLAKRTLPVDLRWEADLPDDYEFKKAELTPEVVEIKGPESLVSQLESIPTDMVELDFETPHNWEGLVELDIPNGIETSVSRVQTRLFFGPVTMVVSMKIPVEVKVPAGLKVSGISPRKVGLIIEMPVFDAREKGYEDKIKAIAVLGGGLGPGRHEVEFKLDMPGQWTLIDVDPGLTVEIDVTKK